VLPVGKDLEGLIEKERAVDEAHLLLDEDFIDMSIDPEDLPLLNFDGQPP
jgi:hypothetical protein